MPTNRLVRGGPTSSARGKFRPRASVAGQGVPGLNAADSAARPATGVRASQPRAIITEMRAGFRDRRPR